jgi:nicotinamidase-related amidase
VCFLPFMGPSWPRWPWWNPHITWTSSRGSGQLVITGAQSDFCVQTTALSALFHGYDVTLVGDAHTTGPATLPGGAVPADSVIELISSRFATLRQPGRRVEVVPAAAIVL